MVHEISPKGLGIIVICCLLLLLTSSCVVLRVVSRRIKGLSLAADDYFILFALLFTSGNSIADIVGVVAGGVGFHVSEISEKQLQITKQCLIAAEVTWALCTTCIKLSLLSLFARVFPLRPFRLMAYTVMALVGLFCFGTLLATFLQCQPLPASWDSGVLAVCGNQTAAWVWTAVTNVVTDVVVLVLPIRGVWTLRLPRKIKIALMGVFGLGFLVCIISILRITSLFNITHEDLTYTKVPADIYSNLEPSLGIVCACLPIMRPIFDRCCPCLRKGSRLTWTPSNTRPQAVSSSERGSKGRVRLDAAETGFAGPDEESGYPMVAVGYQDKAADKIDDGIVITTGWDVERQ